MPFNLLKAGTHPKKVFALFGVGHRLQQAVGHTDMGNDGFSDPFSLTSSAIYITVGIIITRFD